MLNKKNFIDRLVLIIVLILLFPSINYSQDFKGYISNTLPDVTLRPGDWGLQIMIFEDGHGDCILLLTPNGEVVVIDTGRSKDTGEKVIKFMREGNSIGKLNTINTLYTTHYHGDHYKGLNKIISKGIHIQKAFDVGLSKYHHPTPNEIKPGYREYLNCVGDLNDDFDRDVNEYKFVRRQIKYDDVDCFGLQDHVKVRCVGVCGLTKGIITNPECDPSEDIDIDPNDTSIALLITLNDFEFYSAGDQNKKTAEKVVSQGAILDLLNNSDIDLLKPKLSDSKFEKKKIIEKRKLA